MRAATSAASRVARQQSKTGIAGRCGVGGGRGEGSTSSAVSTAGRVVTLRFRSTATRRTVDVRGVFVRGAAGFGGRSGTAAGVAPRDQGFIRIQRAAFHDFFGNGGPGGGGGGGGGGDTEFYDTLGVAKDASSKEIKTAFRKLAMKNHPDQGGDAEKFTKIQEAYEVLSDDDKRRQYDQFGKAGMEGGGFGGEGGFGGGQYEGFDVNDVFSQFFGGGGGRRRGPVKTEDMTYNLSLDLESLYNGITKKIAVNRNALCGTCDGLGAGSASDVTTCSTCGGRGVVITHRQLGPMVQQVQQECPSCGGEGKTIAAGKECTGCGGQKVVRERKTFDVKVKPGTLPNSRLVLRGESNQLPGATPGDVCLVINEKPHPVFKRQGSDLIYEHTLPLADALTGFAVPVEFLDGTTILLSNAPDDPPIAPDTINKVKGKGMQTSSGKPGGDLYVVWKIDMPDTAFDIDTKTQLRKLLGGGEAPDLESEALKDTVKVKLDAATASDRRRGKQRAQQQEEEGGSSCRQM